MKKPAERRGRDGDEGFLEDKDEAARSPSTRTGVDGRLCYLRGKSAWRRCSECKGRCAAMIDSC